MELTEREKKKKKRLSIIWGLRVNDKYSSQQVIQIMMRDYKLSQATAYREYKWAMEIFGDIEEVNLASEKLVIKEALWNAYQKAVKSGNVELEIKALKEYRSLFNFEQVEKEVDTNKIQAHDYNITMPRWVYKKLDAMFVGGVLDFNNLNVEEVEYHEIKEEEKEEDDKRRKKQNRKT